MSEEKLNEYERSYEGCYGSKVKADKLINFLKKNFQMNEITEKSSSGSRFAQCIWGHPGIGKTGIVKQFENMPVTWNGKDYPGYIIKDVPIAQFEEMGDLHGIPYDCFQMSKGSVDSSCWVHKEAIADYKILGYELCPGVASRTMYAPPDWVPLEPGPCILILDDWNRASGRIVKGIMQLLQNYGMVSWACPPGCNIVVTGNPDEQDYLVTTIDSAILTRMKHITLEEDADLWAEWATKEGLDPRGISWVLYQKDMICGKERTNPRTLTEFFRFMSTMGDMANDEVREEVVLHAHGLLDPETVSAFVTFCTRQMVDVIEPLDILDGKKSVGKQIKKLMKCKEPRTDILSITLERLFATLVHEEVEQTDERIKNFQDFITGEEIPEDASHMLCRRLTKRVESGGRNHKWLLGHEKLRDQVMSMLRD